MTGTWPAVNACLNATTAGLLLLGYGFIRAKRIGFHTVCMLLACAVSLAFFTSYVLYHARVGTTRFPGQGLAKSVYLAILISHTVLAIVIVPLVIRTVQLALQRRFETHQRLARLTLPLWLYVSVTGVIVYWMLYRVSW